MPSLREVNAAVIAALIVLGLVGVGSWLLSLLDASVPVWVLLLVGVTCLAVGIFVGRVLQVPSLTADQRGHLRRRVLLKPRHHVRVDVEGEAHRGMAESL